MLRSWSTFFFLSNYIKKSFFSVMCIFIKSVRMAAETQNTPALLNDYVTACNFSVIKNTYSSTKFMLEECYPREQFFLIVCNLSLFNILCIKTKSGQFWEEKFWYIWAFITMGSTATSHKGIPEYHSLHILSWKGLIVNGPVSSLKYCYDKIKYTWDSGRPCNKDCAQTS